MIFSSEAENWEYKIVFLGVIALVMGLTYIIFRMADNLTQRFDHRTANYSANYGTHTHGHCRAICY